VAGVLVGVLLIFDLALVEGLELESSLILSCIAFASISHLDGILSQDNSCINC
jgi:hypothetical protein